MISVNFFDDGVYAVGSDYPETAHVVIYATSAAINDATLIGPVATFISTNVESWSGRGLTYLKIQHGNPAQEEVLRSFKRNMLIWFNALHTASVDINIHEGALIDLEAAVFDAKFGGDEKTKGGLH